MAEQRSPKQVLQAFYSAEKEYMQSADSGGTASFDRIAATLDPAVVLHQSPDLPFGGEFVGHERYEEWAVSMKSIFDRLEVAEQEWFENGDKVIVVCRFKTRSRTNGSTQDLPMVQVVTVQNGLITDFRPFYWDVPPTSTLRKPNSGFDVSTLIEPTPNWVPSAQLGAGAFPKAPLSFASARTEPGNSRRSRNLSRRWTALRWRSVGCVWPLC